VKCVLSNWIQALHSLQANISAFADQIKKKKTEKAVQLSACERERSASLQKGVNISVSQSPGPYVITLKVMFYFQKTFNYVF